MNSTSATLAQTFIFGWQQHPQASLEQMASTAQIANVAVTDSAVHKRFTAACAEFLRRLLEEMTAVVVEAAQPVPLALLSRFRAVILEDSSACPCPTSSNRSGQAVAVRKARPRPVSNCTCALNCNGEA